MKEQKGEIIFEEKYGSSTKERYYVHPPGKRNIITIEKDRVLSEVCSWFAKIFLPQGYPDSVSSDYKNYQIWDTAQAFCSTITGILATQEVLRGVGVGDENATPLAATITWVIKDGCGHLGKIMFAIHYGTFLDAYSKTWRLYADTLNDAAMCIEMSLPMFKSYTTVALCISTVMKAVVGVAGGATRAAMTQHHAIRGNIADVSAKDSSQETAVNLIASLTALLIISLFGNSVLIFSLLMVLHIVFNYFAVRAVCLRTFNEPRFLQVISNYLEKEKISTPCEINKMEPILFYQMGANLLDLKICGFQIKIGCSLKNVVKNARLSAHLMEVKQVYHNRKYVLIPDIRNSCMYVLLKDEARIDDILCAYCHSVILSVILGANNAVDLKIYGRQTDGTSKRSFARICDSIQISDWSKTTVRLARVEKLYDPSVELIQYVNRLVQQEWPKIKSGLTQNGWDLSKHQLMVDEWRLCTKGDSKSTKED